MGSRALKTAFRRAMLLATGQAFVVAAACGGRMTGADDPATESTPDGGASGAMDGGTFTPDGSTTDPDSSASLGEAGCVFPDAAGYKAVEEYECAMGDNLKGSVPIPCEALEPEGELPDGACQAMCADAGMPLYYPVYCQVRRDDAGALVAACRDCIFVGRRPEGWELQPQSARGPVGALFANLAALEAAAVPAFERLRMELAAHDAPPALVERATAAIGDEQRHTLIMTELATRFGGSAGHQDVARGDVRSLSAIAIENAVEGCIRETYGALVAIYQSERAMEPDVRRAMKEIAPDECRHAELAWDVAAFCDERLDAPSRDAVKRAMRESLDALRADLEASIDDDAWRVAGLPGRDDGLRLHAVLETLVQA